MEAEKKVMSHEKKECLYLTNSDGEKNCSIIFLKKETNYTGDNFTQIIEMLLLNILGD